VNTWDYLILTASNDRQAAAYEQQLTLRRSLGLLGQVREAVVVPDPGGRRVGSGGSTVCCLIEVLHREASGSPQAAASGDWLDVLRRLRILIIHAGGDSRRLPAYGPCGKVFVPVPGSSDGALGMTLFDKQLPVYLALPPAQAGLGQVVVTAGDVLLRFDPGEVRWACEGITGLGCLASPQQAAQHGVYCLAGNGRVRRFLQKPPPAVQAQQQAINAYGQAVLDIGVFSLDAATAARLLQLCDVRPGASGKLAWNGPIREAAERHGFDFYREVCCALGTDTTPQAYLSAARDSGSRWHDAALRQVFDSIHATACRAQVLARCDFLHFGTSRQIIESGQQLLRSEAGFASGATGPLCMNSRLDEPGTISAKTAWIEGCAIRQALTLAGENLLVGVDVQQPLDLPRRACLDLLPGRDRTGRSVTFVRCYGVDDTVQGPSTETGVLCGRSLDWWAERAGNGESGLWHTSIPSAERSLWNARLFPAEAEPAEYRRWLWLFEPGAATARQWESWRTADRYSFEEMAALANQEAFHRRRLRLHCDAAQNSLCRWFHHQSGCSAADLAQVLTSSSNAEAWLAAVLQEARRREESSSAEPPEDSFSFARIIHSLGSAIQMRPGGAGLEPATFDRLRERLTPEMHAWLARNGLGLDQQPHPRQWAARAQATAFQCLRRRIVTSGRQQDLAPRNALRSDEIVWGRAPARLDLAGGWTDTPPYALERGGTVLNAAVLLNAQPPVHVYARVTPEPLIRVRSIDLGTHLDIPGWDELFDYSSPVGEFSLVKAALVISGFTPRGGSANRNRPLGEVLATFGGGIELTTLAAIPKGSGLGTSSIMGAVLMAVIHRVMGRTLSPAELFHAVLRLEQELTTGGGWQDQIGGAVGGLKLVSTVPGLLPAPTIRYVPADVLDPKLNGGQTLLYYTGITRLAKNILQQVVGRYLDRDRCAMATLRQIGALAPQTAEAMARKDLAAFGRLIDVAWRLNRQLDPNSSNDRIQELLARVAPHVYGAKLLGAGGGGFLLLVCKSPEDAGRVRAMLEAAPPNELARFFDFEVSQKGLEVSAC
jgi:galactokinase/mevalonate kinase-like predicted kinase